jgi:transcription initiation factor TFIIB
MENEINNEDELWRILDDFHTPDEPIKQKKEVYKSTSFTNEIGCDTCGSNTLVLEEGQHVCTKCNTIQGRVIDSGAEWRYYGAEDNRDEDPTRCGMPTNALLPQSSLGSMIPTRRGESKDIRRIRMYQLWNSMPYWERTLYQIFEQMTNNAQNQGIPSKVLEDSKVLYKTASEKKISRGDNKDGLIASCLYFACASNNVPRSVKEISRMFNIDQNVLTKGNSRFQMLLKINFEPSNAFDFISRFGSKLNMDWNDIQKCKEWTKKMDDMEIVSENAPTSVAAGSLYFYSVVNELDMTKKQIAEICEVSEVTITKCYKRLLRYKKDIVGS